MRCNSTMETWTFPFEIRILYLTNRSNRSPCYDPFSNGLYLTVLDNRSVRNADCRLQTAECRLQNADCRMQNTDCRLQTGYKMQTRYKMETADCRPGAKCRLSLKCRLTRKTAYLRQKRDNIRFHKLSIVTQ